MMDEDGATPKPVTARWLMNVASHYLERYAASEKGVRDMLRRRVRKRTGLPAEPEALAMIDETIASLRNAKLIDDRAFAWGRTETLKRKGLSEGQARLKLAEKGIDRDLAGRMVAEAGFDAAGQALATMRRLRIGPFAREPQFSLADKDMAKLARRGFSGAAIREALRRAREEGGP